MIVRSILFVPADSGRKIERGAAGDADALILDLEDSVAPARKAIARDMARAALDAPRFGKALWVRINALGCEDALRDLAAIVGGRPDVIVLPKAEGGDDVRRLAGFLDALEVREGVARGSIGIVPVATETGAAMFGLGGYAQAPRLAGLTWGAEDLAADVGAFSNRDDHGAPTALYRLARSLCLAAASACRVEAIDTAHMTIGDREGLDRACLEARRDGFKAKLAIHPDQVSVINAAFTPAEAELERARTIVAAYAADPDLGVFQLDGQMIDLPHLKQARRMLSAASGSLS